MKKSLLLSIVFCVLSYFVGAQTKPATIAKPASTTTTKPKTTTAVKKAPVKPAAKTTVAPAPVKPVEAPKAEVAPPPPAVEEVKPPAGPPVTGPLGDGPKSYSADPASKGTTKTSATKNTTSKPAKTVAAKPEKLKRSSAEDAVRSYIGIRGGYNLATLEGIDVDLGGTGSLKNLAGYMGGLVINIGVSKAFSIQPEVLYSQQGAEVVDGDFYAKAKINYVNVPLLLKLAFGSPKVKFFINAGPYVGYALSGTTETNFTGENISEKLEFKTEYDSNGEKDNRIDFGGIGGAGFQFSLGGALLTLEGRYQYGMADPTLYKDGIPASVPKDYGHQRVMTGTVGLLFPLGGR